MFGKELKQLTEQAREEMQKRRQEEAEQYINDHVTKWYDEMRRVAQQGGSMFILHDNKARPYWHFLQEWADQQGLKLGKIKNDGGCEWKIYFYW